MSHHTHVNGWVLCGGESRRMGGQDKGLVMWQGQALAWHVAQALSAQTSQVTVNANRHLDTYRTWPWPVCPDHPDLPPHSGPMVGLLTGLKQCMADWLQLAPCDTPVLPPDLVQQLLQAATETHAQVVVPVTHQAGHAALFHHWTAALVARQCEHSLHEAVQRGERRMGQWITRQRWAAVLFPSASGTSNVFNNMNTPEDLLASTGKNGL